MATPTHEWVGYYDDIEAGTVSNTFYRRVVYTDDNIQIVYMSLLPNEEIGLEVHPEITQFFRVEQGVGIAIIADVSYALGNGIAFAVPKGVYHNIINVSDVEDLKLYTIYTPPQHPPGTVQLLKPKTTRPSSLKETRR